MRRLLDAAVANIAEVVIPSVNEVQCVLPATGFTGGISPKVEPYIS